MIRSECGKIFFNFLLLLFNCPLGPEATLFLFLFILLPPPPLFFTHFTRLHTRTHTVTSSLISHKDSHINKVATAT